MNSGNASVKKEKREFVTFVKYFYLSAAFRCLDSELNPGRWRLIEVLFVQR